MTVAHAPPFRAEHVGSLLRPSELTQAFRAFNAGTISADAFRAVQDKVIGDAVTTQESLGLKLVTDGEFRRASYWGHWVDAVEGLGVAPALFAFHDESGAEQEFIAATCTGKLKKSASISTDEFTFLQSVASVTPKITMPSPSTLHFWRLNGTIAGSGYPSEQHYLADLTAIYRQEIADLYDLGCRYIQLDEVPLIMLANPAIRKRVVSLGGDPERLTALYIEALNAAVQDRPIDMTAALHICRGNFKGKWLTEGGYDDIAECVFGQAEVDAFFLEFDTDRAGSFEPLRHVPPNKKVVLGLVSSKTPQIEDPKQLKVRIREAAEYLPLESLSISPQCGFASTVAGNPITERNQIDKLSALVGLAEEIWGKD